MTPPLNTFSKFKLPLTIGILATIFALVGIFSYQQYAPQPLKIAEVTQIACPTDTFTCPNGSTVSRTNAACEFVCPGRSTLYFNPTSQKLSSTTPSTVVLTTNPNGLEVTGIQAKIVFDPNAVVIDKIEPSTSFPTVLSAPQFATSPATFSFGVQAGSTQITNAPVAIATITYHSKAAPTATAKNATFVIQNDTILTAKTLTTSAFSGGNPTHSLLLQINFLPGDLNLDGKVDLFDFNLLISKYGNPYTIFDFNAIIANYGKNS